MEGLPKTKHLSPALKKATEEASRQYSQMSKMIQVLLEHENDYEGVLE